MIKINLLGEDLAVDYTGHYVVAGYVFSLVILVVALFFAYSSVDASVTDLNGQNQLLEAQLNKLKVVTKEVHELEDKKAELRSKLAIIAKLKRNKVGPVRVMDDLNKALPERAWLTSIKEKDGPALLISGMALDDQIIATFMRDLESSDYFEQVELVQSRKVLWKNAKISEFSLDAKINYAGNLAAPASAQGSSSSAADGKS